MPTIRKVDNGKSCATCRFYRTVEHLPADNKNPEPFCGYDGMPLKKHLQHFSQVGCDYWQPLDFRESVMVYEELTGRRL